MLCTRYVLTLITVNTEHVNLNRDITVSTACTCSAFTYHANPRKSLIQKEASSAEHSSVNHNCVSHTVTCNMCNMNIHCPVNLSVSIYSGI